MSTVGNVALLMLDAMTSSHSEALLLLSHHESFPVQKAPNCENLG